MADAPPGRHFRPAGYRFAGVSMSWLLEMKNITKAFGAVKGRG